MNFPCTSCGLCCTMIRESIRNAKKVEASGRANAAIIEIANFPYAIKEDGSCINLLPDHTCAVYSTRPDICSVKKTWEKHHANISMREYFVQTAEICNSFITEAGFDDKFLINPQIIR